MRIAGVAARDLIAQLKAVPQDGAPSIASQPSNQASIPFSLFRGWGGFVPLSGSVVALADPSYSATLRGQFVTETAPILVPCPVGQLCKFPEFRGWQVESKDHFFVYPGVVNTALLGLPSTINVGGVNYKVVSTVRSATSAVAAHPSIDVGGLTGYALTGIGASVAWRKPALPANAQPPGNMIWKLQPRPDLGGATVASKDHAFSSPASITGFALGIKLVP